MSLSEFRDPFAANHARVERALTPRAIGGPTPTDEQIHAVDIARRGDHLAVEAYAGAGKALRADQPVLTPSGYVPIGSLAVGDTVIGGDGLECSVLGVYPQGVRPLFCITFSDGTEIIADAEHRWLVQRADERANHKPGKIRTTAEMAARVTVPATTKNGGTGRRAYWFVPMTEPVKFAPTELAVDPWLLGVLVGDGTLTGTITLSNPDAQIVDAVRAIVEPMGVKVTTNPSSQIDYRLGGRQTKPGRRGFWNPIVDALRFVGLRDLGSHERFIPDAYKFGDIDTRVAMLQGLFDTDGCRAGPAVEYVSTSERLALDVKFVVESLGGTAVVSSKRAGYKKDGVFVPCRVAYRLYIKVPTWMAPFRLARKMEGWTGGQRPPFRAVRSIEPVEPAEAVCIEVSSANHLFLTAACTPTHNTSTLRLVADALAPQRGMLLAFNRKIIDDAKRSFGPNVACSTVHSVAFRAYGSRFSHRLNAPRMKGWEIARRLGCDDMVLRVEGSPPKRFPRDKVASLAMAAVRTFCQSTDEQISARHVPMPRAAKHDPELKAIYRQIAAAVAPIAARAWDDLCRVDGVLPYSHDVYAKGWMMTRPKLPTDFLLMDESQDLDAGMFQLAEDQRSHAQVVYVGDRFQSVYQWRGAVNAMTLAEVAERCWLTRSFRFGAEIAEVANEVLAMLGARHPLIGGGKPGRVGEIDKPDLLLARTNATAVLWALREIEAGGRPFIVGGADDVVSFARGALQLQEGRPSSHPDLWCFDSWTEVQVYADQDELGADLSLLVKLVDQFGAQVIVDALGAMGDERNATLVLSTAHKFKGAERGSVQLADDFPADPEEMPPEEGNLLYVAATRAQFELDVSAVGVLG